ncbi:MAG: CoA transferase [Solirubrobacterales bacterium]|nr:CoA transferase [Solirubrobacterales bacterium]MCB0863279.1 CoA transferase [Solirubrobacterales bacterium]
MSALSGVIVADFSRVLAGPLAAMTLADLGANVIKVEPPGGDETRSWLPPVDAEGRSTYFQAANRNKRSVSFDLKDEADRALAFELAMRADVLIENFRPKTMERFGLDWESVHAAHPSLVYCSITGFGEGPGAVLPGYDPLIQALSGMMSITGPPDGEASKVGVALVDVIAGLNAATGILAALHDRKTLREGQRVEINLLSTAIAALANQSSAFLNTGVSPSRLGNVHPSIEPFSTFQTATGPIMICAGNDRQFHDLVVTIGAPGLAEDERFTGNLERVENREALRDELERRLKLDSVEYWSEALGDAGVPAGPVNDIGGGFALAESLGLEPVTEIAQTRTTSSPIALSASPAEKRLPPPDLDQQGDEIREWLRGPRDRD